MCLKLNKAIAMLSKLRHVLDIKTLKSVYYTICESQNNNSVKRLHL